jgi:hypothetical protein
MMGANQSRSCLPSAWSIWSARVRAWFTFFTTLGTLSTGYSDWSGYICPAVFASAATCQPER